MNYFKSLIILSFSLVVGVYGCMQQDSSEIIPSSEAEQKSSTDLSGDNADGTLLEVSLTGSSRAERFLGSYDQIDRLALDVVRNYGNKEVVTDLILTQEGGIWKGTVPKLIVDFDYTIRGHAYRPYDNDSDSWTTGYIAEAHSNGNKWLEIFQGQVQHTVVEGTNTLSLRLAPILDDRDLSVPRITRIQRPFQLGTNETSSIEVRVDTVGNGSDDDLSWRFRSMDNQSLPVTDGTRGIFSPDSGDNLSHTSGIYPYIISDYTAPDNSSPCFDDGTEQGQCPQKLQVRVSNLQEIGVTSHFTVYVTDNETAESIVDNNPVITSISAERVGPNQLQWTINISDDDPFDTLEVKWEYLFGEVRSFNDNSSDNLTYNTGRMQTVMEYEDTDDGMLLVTVCETNDGQGECQYQSEGSTSVEYTLIAQSFPEIVICDDTGCELPNSLAGRMDEPKIWHSCYSDNGQDTLGKIILTPKTIETEDIGYDSSDGTCSGNIEWKSKIRGTVELDSRYAYVYPTQTLIDYNGDELKVYKIIVGMSEYLYATHVSEWIDWYNSQGICGYTTNEWEVGKYLNLMGTSCMSDNSTGKWNVYLDKSYDSLRASFFEPGEDYSNELGCEIFTLNQNDIYRNACIFNDRIIVRDVNDNYFEVDNNTGVYGGVDQSNYINLTGNFKEIIYGFKEYVGITDSNAIKTTDNLSENWNNLYQGTQIDAIAHDRSGDYVIIQNGELKCSADNFTSSAGTNLNDITFNQERSSFYAVGDNGSVKRSENCIDWSTATINNVSTNDNPDDNISIAGNNDFIGIVTGRSNYVVWTDTHIYNQDVNNALEDLRRSTFSFGDYTVNDIDWYEAEDRFIGFVEAEYGVTRIEDSSGGHWSNWSGMHSNDGNPFEGIKKIIGGREKLLIAIPDNNTAGFLYMSLDSDNWTKISNTQGSQDIFEIHAF